MVGARIFSCLNTSVAVHEGPALNPGHVGRHLSKRNVESRRHSAPGDDDQLRYVAVAGLFQVDVIKRLPDLQRRS